MYQNDAMKVLTGEVRLSYANLTTPELPSRAVSPSIPSPCLPKSDAAARLTLTLPSRPPP
ncbi:MAG: hypothetical protein ACLSF6_03425 [Evtepia gabavorous]